MDTTETASARQVLDSRFGFSSFRPGQERVIEALLAGRSALAVFPTGAGKSLCYQLPALMLDGVTVVVSPLIALMKDQIDALVLQGVDAARLDSSIEQGEARDVSDRLRSGSLKLLYVAPERFNNERFLAQLAQTPISLFAVDEAHCISEWGHNFRPDYLKLAARARELGAERVLALTATATPAVVADICTGFGIAAEETVVTGFYRANLTLLTTPARAGEREQLLIDRLRERPSGSTIVYVTLQRTALRVASLLAAAGLPARPYHAGLTAEDRSRPRSGGRHRPATSSSRRSPSAWASTRPTCATSITSTCPRVSSRTRRRSAEPAATASLRCASSMPARTTSRRSRTLRSETRPRARRSRACSMSSSPTTSARSSRSPTTSYRAGSTSGRSC